MFRYLAVFLGIFSAAGLCQKPVIYPGGIVNAASYSIDYGADALNTSGGYGLGGGLVSIFGTNLANTTATAQGFPLPIELGGTSVTWWAAPAHLLFVSPNQINLEMHGDTVPGDYDVVVSTAAGSSDPFRVGIADTIGIFTDNGSGCGQGAILNVSNSGEVSVNSTFNSVSPGDLISVYGTGGLAPGYHNPPDGYPAPSTPPLAESGGNGGFLFDFDNALPINNNYWFGLAPGLVGVAQLNQQLPETLREGCAVPVQFSGVGGMSQPVTMAVRKGGGPCIDPPSAGYGEIVWQKTIITSRKRVGERDFDHGIGYRDSIATGVSRKTATGSTDTRRSDRDLFCTRVPCAGLPQSRCRHSYRTSSGCRARSSYFDIAAGSG